MTDERYQKIMADLGMSNSISLLQALQQVANEVTQQVQAAERDRIVNALPGGHSVDPQWVADMVRNGA